MDWFGSPYYNILYQHRNDKEASAFLDNLLNFLKVPSNSSFLDIACGRGRHAVYLNKKGHKVTGIDLSSKSIAHAKQFANEDLIFKEHNILDCFKPLGKFDVLVNLFTSFGYFNSFNEHQQALTNFKSALAPNGYLVLDYLNAEVVIKDLIPEEDKILNGISFKIARYYQKPYLFKKIEVVDQDSVLQFYERVWAFTLSQFIELLNSAGFQLKECFGDYELNSFDVNKSLRMILIAQAS